MCTSLRHMLKVGWAEGDTMDELQNGKDHYGIHACTYTHTIPVYTYTSIHTFVHTHTVAT